MRVVIVSSPRCGTHLVASAILGHDGFPYRKNRHVAEPFNLTSLPYGEGRTTQEIWDLAWRERMGFVLHRTQGGLGKPKNTQMYGCGAWDLLRENKDIKIVSVDRQDWLKRFVSNEISLKDRVWQLWAGQDREAFCGRFQLKVNPAAVVQYVVSLRKLKRLADEQLADHDVVEVLYEDVVADPQKEFGRLQDFLGLPRKELVPATAKQESRRMREVVINYDEVAAVLKDRLGITIQDEPDGEVLGVGGER